MAQGYLCIVLHAHLPYVRHPEKETFLEERWLFEGITETYLPLLAVFERLAHDQVPFRLTISLSPTLMAMLQDELLKERYSKYLDLLLELAEKELTRTKGQKDFYPLAQMYHRKLTLAHDLYHYKYRKDLLKAFKKFQDLGYLEIITCSFTHGYLPLLDIQQEVVKAQVKLAVAYYQKQFGTTPLGFWLPECGYQPEDDQWLKENKIKYFFTDAHGVLFATPRPRYAVYAPIRCPSGVAAFGRDMETSKQVWSATEGYPGDFDYREFYRDIGYDLDFNYIKPYIHDGSIRVDTGFKYYRITGKSDYKEPYVPAWAEEKAAIHAGNFMFNRERQIEYLASQMDRPPVVVAPYDAELFGHWWFEGPTWLEYVCRKSAYDQQIYELITPHDYLKKHPAIQPATPSASSWGANGYHDVWLNGSNDWIYPHLHYAAQKMINLANFYSHNKNNLVHRALKQAAREILLAQSSDWAFMMKTGTMTSYAVRRTNNHLGRFFKLVQQLEQGRIDADWLNTMEAKDNIYPELDYRAFASP